MAIPTTELQPGRLVAAADDKQHGKGWLATAGGTINKFDIVVPNGTVSTSIQVVQASNATAATARGPLFIADHASTVGRAVRIREVRGRTGVNTLGRTVGDPVYLGTGGATTFTRPGGTAIPRVVGRVVVVDVTNGVILLDPNAETAAEASDLGGAAVAPTITGTGSFTPASMGVYRFDLVDQNADTDVTVPFAVRVLPFISVLKTDAPGGGGTPSVQILNGASAITNAMSLTGLADQGMVGPTSVDDGQTLIANGGTLRVRQAGGTNSACEVNILVVRA